MKWYLENVQSSGLCWLILTPFKNILTFFVRPPNYITVNLPICYPQTGLWSGVFGRLSATEGGGGWARSGSKRERERNWGSISSLRPLQSVQYIEAATSTFPPSPPLNPPTLPNPPKLMGNPQNNDQVPKLLLPPSSLFSSLPHKNGCNI